MERITDTHVYFWGSILSNWNDCKFTYKEIEFDNTEQAFMWEKTNFFNDKETADLILKTPNPRENKKLGRKVKSFNADEWFINAFIVMIAVNYCKYSQNNKYKKTLLSTGDKTIVEASPYDKIWGVGLAVDDDRILNEVNWTGMNLLGKALMEVRKTLKDEKYN